jgi:hypothetical protein
VDLNRIVLDLSTNGADLGKTAADLGNTAAAPGNIAVDLSTTIAFLRLGARAYSDTNAALSV